jgi:hypothetical protein
MDQWKIKKSLRHYYKLVRRVNSITLEMKLRYEFRTKVERTREKRTWSCIR